VSDEYTEEVAEEVVGEELTAEEIFAQHQAEISARFEEKTFIQRMKDMFAGLSKPRSSPEYKLARTELQRLAAPLLAILLPALGIIALIVITAVTGQSKEVVQVEIASAQEQEEDLKEEDEPEPEVEPETQPDEQVDVQVDTPNVSAVTDLSTPTPTPSNEPVSVKPATQDSVAIIKSPVTMKSMVGSRTPGMIGKFTSGGAGYGDKNTEAAVLKALRWLKFTQSKDGSWNVGGSALANTSLAVLAFLAHGETPASKEFGETVEKAMQYLIDCQYNDKDGTPRFKGADGNEYAVLIATYALCESYGMTKNPLTKDVALRTLDRIVKNQSPTGGWDYKINKTSTRDDMSFAGWALQALKAGKMAGLHPEGLDECIKKAVRCLQKRNFNKIGFNYVANGAATGLTATGCLAMQLLGYGNQPEVATALETMKAWKPVFESKETLKPGGPTPGASPQYYCYYAAQCKYQAGMKEGASAADVKIWQDWNAAMKALYPPSMKTLDKQIEGPDGKMHAMGFWEKGYNCHAMGTCLVALQLMVYYRYLPTTQTKAGKVENDDGDAKSKKKAKKAKKETVDVDVDI